MIPIFLASKTQEIFTLRCDEDVTGDNPFKFLAKDDILQDMFNRAAVCDFTPYKQQIQVRFFSYGIKPFDKILILNF